MKDTKFVEKYALVIKDLFEDGYHRILDDEDLVERLIDEFKGLKDKIDVLEDDLQAAMEDLYEAECEVDRLQDEIDDLDFNL